MSQNGEEAKAQPAQNLNQTNVLTYIVVDGLICIISIASPDGKTRFFGNGTGTIVLYNHITRKGSKDTIPDKRKQYTMCFENGKWKVYLGETDVHTLDEIFGLPDGITHIKNVSFRQFKYVLTADDEITASFRYMLMQICKLNPDRFCLEDPKKQMEVHEGGTKVRIPLNIYKTFKKFMKNKGFLKLFVKRFHNSSEIGACRGDLDFYVRTMTDAEVIIKMMTDLRFEKFVPKDDQHKAKSNGLTYTLSLDRLSEHLTISPEELIRMFNLPEGSDPAQYYIEVEIKIATEFQKAYESNCLGYFIGLLLSHFLKISISGVWLKTDSGEIPLNVASFDDFLKKLGINLDGIRTTHEFIERLLSSPLISELLTVGDILRLYKNIMGDEKMKHTSKPLRQWLHLILCGLKERFPERFSSLRSELVEKMVCDEKSGQNIPTWSVRLFFLNPDSESEVQMENGDLSISVSGKKLFVSTGADGTSLIFSEEQLKSNSGKKALHESVKSCSRLFELLKDYFDHLKEINLQKPIVEQFIHALGCHSEVGTHFGKVGFELMKEICEELMKPLYPIIRTKPASMSGLLYGVLMKELKPTVIDFSQFEEFCVERLGLVGDYKSFVIRMMNHEIFHDYSSRIDALSPELSLEEHKQMRGEIYDDAIRNIVKLCLELVEQWTHFHRSDLFWTNNENVFFHIPSQTYHKTEPDSRPCYLGTSVLVEVSSESLPSKGKKPKGKPQGKTVPEEKPEGKPVHVFMDGKTGEVFTVLISE